MQPRADVETSVNAWLQATTLQSDGKLGAMACWGKGAYALNLRALRIGYADFLKNRPLREPFLANRGITNTVSLHEDDERELIGRAQAGEVVAFEQLARRHAARRNPATRRRPRGEPGEHSRPTRAESGRLPRRGTPGSPPVQLCHRWHEDVAGHPEGRVRCDPAECVASAAVKGELQSGYRQLLAPKSG